MLNSVLVKEKGCGPKEGEKRSEGKVKSERGGGAVSLLRGMQWPRTLEAFSPIIFVSYKWVYMLGM